MKAPTSHYICIRSRRVESAYYSLRSYKILLDARERDEQLYSGVALRPYRPTRNVYIHCRQTIWRTSNTKIITSTFLRTTLVISIARRRPNDERRTFRERESIPKANAGLNSNFHINIYIRIYLDFNGYGGTRIMQIHLGNMLEMEPA